MSAEQKKLAGSLGGLNKQRKKIEAAGGQMSNELRNKLKKAKDGLAQLKSNPGGRVAEIKAEDDDDAFLSSLDGLLQDEPSGSATGSANGSAPEKPKRSNSTSSGTSKLPPAKRVKANMLADTGLSFAPTSNPDHYVPLSLLANDVSSKDTLEIPKVMMFSEGKAYELTFIRNTKEDDRNFWMALRAKVQLLEPVLANHHFGVIKDQDLEVLKLGEALLPKLLGHGGRLRYEALEKDKINKNVYKEYLGMITANLATMSATKNVDMKKATHQDPLTAQGVATKLQGGMANKLLISHDEHSRVLSQQATFFASTVDTVRRELVQYGLVVSNLADETKRQRSEISELARVFMKLLEAHGPTDTITTTAASNASEPPDTDMSHPSPGFRLPAIFLRAIDPGSHQCMCESCMPEYAKTLAERAEKKAAASYQQQLRAEVKVEMVRGLEKSLAAKAESDAKQVVRDKLKSKIKKEVLQEAKDQLAQELRAEWEATHAKEIEARLQKDYYEKMTAAFIKPAP